MTRELRAASLTLLILACSIDSVASTDHIRVANEFSWGPGVSAYELHSERAVNTSAALVAAGACAVSLKNNAAYHCRNALKDPGLVSRLENEAQITQRSKSAVIAEFVSFCSEEAVALNDCSCLEMVPPKPADADSILTSRYQQLAERFPRCPVVTSLAKGHEPRLPRCGSREMDNRCEAALHEMRGLDAQWHYFHSVSKAINGHFESNPNECTLTNALLKQVSDRIDPYISVEEFVVVTAGTIEKRLPRPVRNTFAPLGYIQMGHDLATETSAVAANYLKCRKLGRDQVKKLKQVGDSLGATGVDKAIAATNRRISELRSVQNACAQQCNTP